MQVAIEPFNFLLLPANIQYFSVLIDGQSSKGCRFDALHDLHNMRLTLLCLICKVSDVVGRERSSPDQTVTQNKDLRPVTGPEGN